MLYGGSVFGISDDQQLFGFLEHISPRYAHHMRHIFVALKSYSAKNPHEWAAACTTLMRLPNLRTVDFDLYSVVLPPFAPDEKAVVSFLKRLAPFEGQSPRSGVWSLRFVDPKEWGAILEGKGMPFIVKDVDDPRFGTFRVGLVQFS
ncbi:hypothetical protein SLS58_002930 [Diplodia intermedia]|uniref:Uncharacterized protein n=1 Tax=Diplodia intermedia TaxID=856260 RepID=A0ABR3TYS7_9PEZI